MEKEKRRVLVRILVQLKDKRRAGDPPTRKLIDKRANNNLLNHVLMVALFHHRTLISMPCPKPSTPQLSLVQNAHGTPIPDLVGKSSSADAWSRTLTHLSCSSSSVQPSTVALC